MTEPKPFRIRWLDRLLDVLERAGQKLECSAHGHEWALHPDDSRMVKCQACPKTRKLTPLRQP